MDQEQNSSLFGLSIDAQSRSFLTESAKWGKFLAIIGFIVCGIVIIVGIIFAINAPGISKEYAQYEGVSQVKGFGVMMAVVYILIALIYFFPCLYLFKFANHMKAALKSEDQGNLVYSFQNLKSMFKFVGIFTIIIIAFWLLGLALGIAGSAFNS